MEICRSRQWGGWITLAGSVAIYEAVSLLMHQPFHAGGMDLRYFDLRIYRLSALRVTDGAPLYGTPMLRQLGFTYPPFAALILAPLAWLPLTVDEPAVTGLNVVLLVLLVRRALMLAPLRARVRAWSLSAGVAGAAMWLEPTSVTLGYGQINLLIAALVVFDLSRRDAAGTKGIGIGLAAAIKLTPLLFIPYLLLSRRRRGAAVATLTFAASVALSFLVMPGNAATYWLHKVLQTSRIGDPTGVANQSLHGTIARLTGAAQPSFGWYVVIIAIVLGGLALANRASRHGDEALGFSVAALSTLLASPISWSHHWTLAVPAFVLLAFRAYDQRSRCLMAATAVLGVAGYAYLPEIAESDFGSARGPASLLTTNPYPLIGVVVLSLCGASVAWARLRHSGPRLRVRSAARLASAVIERALASEVR